MSSFLKTVVLRQPSPSGLDRPVLAAKADRLEQITTLQWAIGAFCALLGALMLVAPHHSAVQPTPL